MVVPDFTDEELSLSGDLKVREMPLEAQKSGSPPWRIRKLTLTVTVLLFTNVFLAASTVTLYCFCRDLSHRVYTLETVLQSKTTDIGSTVQSNPKHEVTIDQQDDLPVPLRQARSRRRHIDGNGRNKTNIDRCPKSCRGRRGKKGDKGEQGVPGVCLTNCSAAPPMTFAHLAGIQAPSNSSDLFHFKAPESEFASGFRVVEGNKVDILDSGVFFVYSQVTYNNVAARNGFLVKIRRTPEGPPESFVSCILGSSGVTPSNHSGDEEGANLIYKPCFTAGTVHLKAGATLWMEHPYTGPGHDIKLMPHLTFLGLIRLSPG